MGVGAKSGSRKTTRFNGKTTGSQIVKENSDSPAGSRRLLPAELGELVEVAPIGIYLSALNGRFLFANPRLVQMLGYSSEEEVLGLDLATDVYFDPAERGRLINESLASQETSEVEVQWKTKSGLPIWLSMSAYPVLHQDGSLKHFKGFVKDITAWKQAQEKLFQREEFFRSIIENSADAVVLVDAAGRIQYAVQKDAVGYNPSDIIGEQFSACIHPDDQAALQEKFREILSKPNERISFNARAQRENGEWRNLDMAARNLLANPAVQAIVVNFRDVTDRTVAETLRKESEAKYRQLVEQASDGIMIVSMDGTLQFVNEKLCQMTGFTRQELKGKSVSGTYPPASRNDAMINLKQAHEKTSAHLDRPMLRKDGTVFPVEVSIRKLSDGNFQGIVRDVTERKEIENALRESEHRFRELLETVDLVAMVLDMNGSIVFANQKLMDLSKRSDLVGTDWFRQFIPEDDRLRMSAVFRSSVKEQNIPRSFENDIILAGERRTFLWANTLIKDSDGRIVGTASIGDDVTERLRTVRALSESEARYRSLFENLLNGFAYCKMIFEDGKPSDFVYLDVNKSFERLTGLNNVVGKNVSEVIPGLRESNPGLLATYGRVASTCIPEQFETYVEQLKMWFSISVYSPEQGYFVAVFDVITERKNAEQVLSAERNTLLTVINSLPDRIYVKDRECRFLLNNEAHIRALGCKTQQEVLGKTDADFRSSELANKSRKDDLEVITSGRAMIDVNESINNSPGRKSSFLVTKVPLVDEHGVVTGLVGITKDVTNLRNSEKILRESEEKFRSLAEESPNMIFINKGGKVVYANKRCEEIMGYTREEMTSSSFDFRVLIDPESLPIVEKNMESHKRGESVAPYEYGLINKKGEKVFGLHSTKLIKYDGGPAILGIITDITEQRNAANTQRRLLTAVEQSHDVIFMTDVAGRITYVNPSFERVYGITRAEAIGNTPRILKSGFYSREYYFDFWSKLLNGQSQQKVVTNKTRDGRLITMEVSVSPVLASDGSIQGFLAVQTDITQRRKAEEKVLEQAALLDIATDAIIVIDQEGNIQFWNKSAEQLYGWHAADTMDRFICDILKCERPEVNKALEATLNSGSWEGEITTFSSNGRSVLAQSRWTLRRDEQGNPKSILVVNSDITEKKVLQKQFYHSQRLDSLGTLAGGIAHDLNNVLSPILLSFEVLGRFVKEDQAKKLLKTALESANRGKQIVGQVLTFARGSEGRKGPVQVRHLIDEAMNIIKETFPKSIEIEPSVGKNLWTINADPTQIHQVIMNLLVNARDAMTRGGTLTVSAENLTLDEYFCRTQLRAHPGPYVVLTIGDTGSGIAHEILERIFDPFFTTKEVGKGTGLGLSTVHTIVSGHEGFVDVRSVVGQGTTFKVYFPATMERVKETREIGSASTSVSAGGRVLVIDDERAIREITEQVLASSGFQVTTAADGVEAIASFAEQRGNFDLILTDLMMPIMDGVATVRALRRIRPDVTVIVMSGMMADEKIFDSQDFKPEAFLTKPFTAETLLQTIEKVIKMKPGAASQK